jgi:hypothetical protein
VVCEEYLHDDVFAVFDAGAIRRGRVPDRRNGFTQQRELQRLRVFGAEGMPTIIGECDATTRARDRR